MVEITKFLSNYAPIIGGLLGAVVGFGLPRLYFLWSNGYRIKIFSKYSFTGVSKIDGDFSDKIKIKFGDGVYDNLHYYAIKIIPHQPMTKCKFTFSGNVVGRKVGKEKIEFFIPPSNNTEIELKNPTQGSLVIHFILSGCQAPTMENSQVFNSKTPLNRILFFDNFNIKQGLITIFFFSIFLLILPPPHEIFATPQIKSILSCLILFSSYPLLLLILRVFKITFEDKLEQITEVTLLNNEHEVLHSEVKKLPKKIKDALKDFLTDKALFKVDSEINNDPKRPNNEYFSDAMTFLQGYGFVERKKESGDIIIYRVIKEIPSNFTDWCQ